MDKKFIRTKKIIILCNGIIFGTCLFLWLYVYPHDIRIAAINVLCIINCWLITRDNKNTSELIGGLRNEFNEIHENKIKEMEKMLQQFEESISETQRESGRVQVFITAIKELYKDKNN